MARDYYDILGLSKSASDSEMLLTISMDMQLFHKVLALEPGEVFLVLVAEDFLIYLKICLVWEAIKVEDLLLQVLI